MYTCVHANMEGRGVHPGSSIILYLGFQLWIPFFFLFVCVFVCLLCVLTHAMEENLWESLVSCHKPLGLAAAKPCPRIPLL